MKLKLNKTTLKKHQKSITIVAIILAILAAAAIAFFSLRANSITRTDPNSSGEPAEPAVVFEDSPLTGQQVTPDLAKLPIIAIVVENSPEARPQSGLIKAGVIYESVAEGGITRFVALHQENIAEKIGPVRSLRTYHIDFGMGFDAGIAHVGGDPKALAEFRSMGGKDLDQFVNAGSYYRSSDRWAPHNMYTSGQAMRDLMNAKGYTSSEFAAWTRKDGTPLEVPTASTIVIQPSSYLYKVSYSYNPATNTYNRLMADQPHKDQETAKQINPNAVVVVKAPHSIVDASGHYAIGLVGTGEAIIFQDGGSISATWKKDSRTSNINFIDAEGQPIPINRGQTWITVIAPDRPVESTP